jgi:hypothetical protein
MPGRNPAQQIPEERMKVGGGLMKKAPGMVE